MITVSQQTPLMLATCYLLVNVLAYRVHLILAKRQVHARLVMVRILLLPHQLAMGQETTTTVA